MKASLVLIVALFIANSVIANSASAESPEFATIRQEVTAAIENCRTNGDHSSLTVLLERLAPEVANLTPQTQADRDTLKELSAAALQYSDC